MLKNKRVWAVALAVVFLVSLFFVKNKSLFINTANETGNGLQMQGLVYGDEIVGDLVSRDTDLDGVLDWEESLWGTDPTKRDTNDDGVSDNVEIAKIKSVTGAGGSDSLASLSAEEEKLTETDKFSREFFSTIATLNQTGVMDQTSVDRLSSSLAEHIENSVARKIYLLSDLKVIKDDTLSGVKKYDTALTLLQKKYPAGKTVMDVLQKFVVDEETVDLSVLLELDPIIKQTNNIVLAMVNMEVPEELAPLHLELINVLQRLYENMKDIKLYDTDVIVALSAISQYETNTTVLESVANKLGSAIENELNN